MRNLALMSLLTFFLFSCGNSPKSGEQTATVSEKEAVVYSVDDLYKNAADIVDKEVVVKGTVMHVCKEGGVRCFLMGSNEEINIRVEAGEKIGAFSQEQMGSDLEIIGILKEVKTEADAHNPGQHEGEEQAEHNAATSQAHNIIAESQNNADIVYFIEGLNVKEL